MTSDIDEEVSGPPRKKQRLECCVEENMSPLLGMRRELSDLLEPCYAWCQIPGVQLSYNTSYDQERKAMDEAHGLAFAMEDSSYALNLVDFFTDKALAIQHLSRSHRKREAFDTYIFPQTSWDQLGELWFKAVGQKALSIQGFEHTSETQSYQLLAMKLEGLLYEGRGAFVAPKLSCWRKYWEGILGQGQDDVVAAVLESFSEIRPGEVLGLKEALRAAGFAIAITQGQGGIFKPATGALCLLQLLQNMKAGALDGGSLYSTLNACRKALHRALCGVLRWPFPFERSAGNSEFKTSRGSTLIDLTEALVAKNVIDLDESVLVKGQVIDSVVEATGGSRRIIAYCIAHEMQDNASHWTAEDAFLLAQHMAECGFDEPAFRAGLTALMKRWPTSGALHWVLVQSQAPGLHDPRARLQSILDHLTPETVTGHEMVRTILQLSAAGREATARALAERFVTQGWSRNVELLYDNKYVPGLGFVLDAWTAGVDDSGVLSQLRAVTTLTAALRCSLALELAKRMEATGRHACMFRLRVEATVRFALPNAGHTVLHWAAVEWFMTKAVEYLNTDAAAELVAWSENHVAAADECGADLVQCAYRLARAADAALGNVKVWRQLAVRVLELAHGQWDRSVPLWREAVAVWRLLGPSAAKELARMVDKKGPENRKEALELARVLTTVDDFPAVVAAAWRRALRLLFQEAKLHAGVDVSVQSKFNGASFGRRLPSRSLGLSSTFLRSILPQIIPEVPRSLKAARETGGPAVEESLCVTFVVVLTP